MSARQANGLGDRGDLGPVARFGQGLEHVDNLVSEFTYRVPVLISSASVAGAFRSSNSAKCSLELHDFGQYRDANFHGGGVHLARLPDQMALAGVVVGNVAA